MTVNEGKTLCSDLFTVLLLKWLLQNQCSPWAEESWKRSQWENERIVRAKEATLLHSAVCLEIELQGYITVSQSYCGRWVYVPTSGSKWLFFPLQNSKDVPGLSPSTHPAILHINMIYQECGMFYKLYDCLDFMVSSVCIMETNTERKVLAGNMSAVHRHSGVKVTSVFSLALSYIKWST